MKHWEVQDRNVVIILPQLKYSSVEKADGVMLYIPGVHVLMK